MGVTVGHKAWSFIRSPSRDYHDGYDAAFSRHMEKNACTHCWPLCEGLPCLCCCHGPFPTPAQVEDPKGGGFDAK